MGYNRTLTERYIMYKPKNMPRALNASFPVIESLAEAGHFGLAMKTLFHAYRADTTIIRKRKAARKFKKKLERLEMESYVIEMQICQAMHPDC